MEQLRTDLASVEQQLAAEKQKGSEGDRIIIARLESEQTHILEQIALAEQQEREQQIEEKIEGDEITFNVPGVDFKELPAELITLIDKVVRADRRRIYAEENEKVEQLTADHREAMRAAADRELQAVRQNDTLQEKFKGIVAERDEALRSNSNLLDQAARVNQENDDLQKRLKNATDLIDEKQREIERQESEIQDMRAAANFGEKQAQQIIDVTPQETADMQNLVNNIAKKYVSATQIGANWHELVAEDGSKAVVHTKDLPSLETQGSPFRGNDQSGQTDVVLPDVVQGPQFPDVKAPDVDTSVISSGGVQGQSSDGTSQAKEGTDGEAPVTRAEFEKRVGQLESYMDAVTAQLGLKPDPHNGEGQVA